MKSFTTQSCARDRQLHVWQEIMSDVYYSLEVKGASSDGLRGNLRQYDVGCVSITSFDSDSQRCLRTKARIARDPDDSFVFVTPVRKDLYFSQAGRSGLVKPGGYVLVSTSEFYELSCPDGFINWTVKIPGPELRRRIPDVDDYCACRFPNNLSMARIARNHIRSIATITGGASLPNEAGVAANLIDIISLAVGSEAYGAGGDRQSHYRMRRRIMDFIRQNIHDTDLTPSLIAEKNGISLSYLYKLFQSGDTTVGEYIMAERLQLAYEHLAASDKTTVAEAAYSSGFRNLSHFSRVFRERYKVSPSAIRKQPT